MGLQGKFEWHSSLRAGGMKSVSFTLSCDNLYQREIFDCAIMSNNGVIQPMIFRNQTLKARQSVRFDFDTVDWQWCNGDTFVILGKNDSIRQKWVLNIQKYAPGECPECHGTHKCRKCSGRGFLNLPHHTIEQCEVCNGTGTCQTCYVPERGIRPGVNPGSGQQTNRGARDRQIEGLRKNIQDLQRKIEKTEWDIRMMELKDIDRTNPNVCLSYRQLLYQYNVQMIGLQSELEQLEQLR